MDIIEGGKVYGENNPAWNGGVAIDGSGYRLIKKYGHPRTNHKGYVREHILVFEKTYDCCVLKWGIIHHIDCNKHNNVWYNLKGMSRSQHISYHKKGKIVGSAYAIKAWETKRKNKLLLYPNIIS